MADVEPDTRVLDLNREQPEFNEQLWQYLNRRVSHYRITTGKVKAKEYASLLSRVEKDYGVDRFIMLAIWGIESAFGDPDVQKNHMRPVIPALAALAWGEPRRRAYWEQELLNALIIIDRGWSTPDEMRGSWAGAMGHTQWMPEVWLNSGVDYDGDLAPSSARPLSPRCKKSSNASPRSVSTLVAPMAGSATTPCSRSATFNARSAWSPPMVMLA
jgi:membrane-bound lytic murein transglycosylase B